MKFAPKKENELSAGNLIPDGTYPFEVIKAVAKQSKAGNDMIVVTLKIFEGDTHGSLLDDYLMESIAFKLFHFCAYSGLTAQYESGTLTAENCVGRTGYAKIGVQKGKAKDDGGFWPDRNTVKDYIRQEMKKAGVVNVTPSKPASKPADDDVPY
jgi:hypothetical protein